MHGLTYDLCEHDLKVDVWRIRIQINNTNNLKNRWLRTFEREDVKEHNVRQDSYGHVQRAFADTPQGELVHRGEGSHEQSLSKNGSQRAKGSERLGVKELRGEKRGSRVSKE